MMKKVEKILCEELSDVLVRPEMTVLNGRNLFEKMLWERGRVDGVVQRLEDDALEAALTPTNAPAIQ